MVRYFKYENHLYKRQEGRWYRHDPDSDGAWFQIEKQVNRDLYKQVSLAYIEHLRKQRLESKRKNNSSLESKCH